ncbi:hypothetical protein [Amphritea sp. HPY]|uniref:hypothetical protein n=1 Tax=Amphritea sp. HPY TaxID=3421652 RepID=UPI003D7D72A9
MDVREKLSEGKWQLGGGCAALLSTGIINYSFFHIIAYLAGPILICLGVFNVSSSFAMIYGWKRTLPFQILGPLLIGGMAAFLFIPESGVLNIKAYVGQDDAVLLLGIYAAVAWVSWMTAHEMNLKLPVRALLISTAVVFVLCKMGEYGVSLDRDSEESLNSRQTQYLAENGKFFFQYVTYWLVSHITILFVWFKRVAQGTGFQCS